MDTLLSVIVPAYNAEEWVESCICSILRITVPYSDALEVIVVDDGSTDNTPMVLKRLQEEGFKRVSGFSVQGSEGCTVRVIRQENRGLSAARNAGLHMAKGKYVAFVDADDEWISLDSVWNYLLKSQSEIIGLDIVRIPLNGRKTAYRRYKAQYDRIFAPSLSFLKNRNLFPPAWAYIYAKDLIERENLYFTEGIYHEDEDFTTRAFLLARSFVAVPGPHYLYIERTNSITTSQDADKLKKRMNDLLYILEKLLSFSRPEQQNALRLKIYFIATDMVRVLLKCKSDKDLISSVLLRLKALGLYPFPFYPNLHYLAVRFYLSHHNRVVL